MFLFSSFHVGEVNNITLHNGSYLSVGSGGFGLDKLEKNVRNGLSTTPDPDMKGCQNLELIYDVSITDN